MCLCCLKKDDEEMNEHPLALENGNVDAGLVVKKKKKKKQKSLVANSPHLSWMWHH